jgi:hypothetical protein
MDGISIGVTENFGWLPAGDLRTGAAAASKATGAASDYNNALLVEEIIRTKAPKGDWQRNLEGVCQALDEAKAPPPEAWQRSLSHAA